MKASQHVCSNGTDALTGVNVLTLRLEWAGEDKSSASLVIETLVDGEPIANFNIVATDLYQLALSTKGEGEYQILNCWCGLPACARLSGGIHVLHPDHAVQWNLELSSMSRGERPAVQRFRFEREQYVREIRNFANELAAELERETTDGERRTGIVLYSENRCIQEGGIDRALSVKRVERRVRKVE